MRVNIGKISKLLHTKALLGKKKFRTLIESLKNFEDFSSSYLEKKVKTTRIEPGTLGTKKLLHNPNANH